MVKGTQSLSRLGYFERMRAAKKRHTKNMEALPHVASADRRCIHGDDAYKKS